MKTKIFIILAILTLLIVSTTYANEHRGWYASSVTGDAPGSMDGAISAVSPNPNDAVFVVTGDRLFYPYRITNRGGAEDFPHVVLPDAIGAGTTRYEIADLASGVSTERTIVGGVSIYNLTASQTLTSEMMRGSYIGNYGAAAEVTYTLLTAFMGASCNISFDQDQTSGSTIWVLLQAGDTILNKPDFVGGTGAGTSYYYLSGTTSGSVSFIGKATNIWRVWEENPDNTITQGSVE